MALETQVANLVAASSALTAVVDNKIQDIDQKVAVKARELDQFIAHARLDYPFFRLTKNQFGSVSNGSLEHYIKNNTFSIAFSDYRTIYTGTLWADRDAEEKTILTAMGRQGVQHFQPNIKVVKMSWSGWNASMSGHTFHHYAPFASSATCASYARLLSGEITPRIAGHGFQGITHEWGLCGTHYGSGPGNYTHNHPYVSTPSGEVLFLWYAMVSGHVPLDRKNPKWGFYPFINVADVTI
jgi:hypothetical protein